MVRVRSEKVANALVRRHRERAAERLAPPGLLAITTVTVPLNADTRLPELSSALTVRPKGLPAVTLVGALTTDKVSPFSTMVPTAWLSDRVAPSGLERLSVKVRGAVWLPPSRMGRDRRGRAAGRERERAAGRHVIGAGEGRAVGGGVVHRQRQRARPSCS